MWKIFVLKSTANPQILRGSSGRSTPDGQTSIFAKGVCKPPACNLISYCFAFSLSRIEYLSVGYALFAADPLDFRCSQGEPISSYQAPISISNYNSTFVSSLITLHAMHVFLGLSSLVSAVLAASRTYPPSGSLTVGPSGNYTTVDFRCPRLQSCRLMVSGSRCRQCSEHQLFIDSEHFHLFWKLY